MVLAGGPFGLGAPELLIVLAIVILLFGATRIGDVMGSLGKGVKEFKKNVQDDEGKEVDAPRATTAPTEPAPVASAGNGMIAAVKCASCGALNEASAKHCNQCGHALAAPVS